MNILLGRLKPRHLVIAGFGMVALQYGLAGVAGFAPPSFKAGYERPFSSASARPVVESPAGRSLRALEDILSPPPVLNWAERLELTEIDQIPQSAAQAPDARPAGLEEPEEVGPAGDGRLALLDRPLPRPDAPVPAAAAPTVPEADYGRRSLRIEPVYLRTLPDLEGLSSDERKRRFVTLMLPLVLRSNIELENRRSRVREAIEEGNLDRLRQWGELYGYTPGEATLADYERELLKRVATVPVSIAIAQAAVESGWGTSRFAVRGNALMGQWAWSLEAGIRPREPRHDDMVVRAFASLFDSVRAYMHNLNSHPSYDAFREIRSHIGEPAEAGDINRLVGQLGPYSELRGEYVEKIWNLIESNDLIFYEQAQLLVE